MLVSYLVSVAGVVVLFLFGVLVSGASPSWYADLPSAALVLVPAFVLEAGDSGWKGIGAAFSVAFGKKVRGARDLSEADAVFAGLGRYAWYGSAMGVFIGTIAILGSLSEFQKVGPNFAVTLICPFYALLFYFVLVLPARRRIGRGSADTA